MAILTKGIFGPVSGRIGNLVFCICVNGTNYVRTRPNKTKKPPTAAQIIQRKKFALAANFLNPIKDIIKIGYHKTYRKKGSGPMSLAMSAMLRFGIIADEKGPRIDFPNVQLSAGGLQSLMQLKMKMMGSNIIMVEWM